MTTAQLVTIINKVIESNPTIQALRDAQSRQSVEQSRQSAEQSRQSAEQSRQGAEQSRQRANIQVLKDEQHRQGVILEDIQTQVQMIAEAVTPLLKNFEAVLEIKNTLVFHSQEITMTQQSFKNHLRDPNAHNNIEEP